jgi:hypothetical protein
MLSPVSTTPVKGCSQLHQCQRRYHGFSVIAGVIDTGDKFLTSVNVTGGDNDTSEQLSPVTTTPVNKIYCW